jgi:hypothetical protein
MPTVQQWCRRESIIWPPRHYSYTLGAIFLSLVATGLFVYIWSNSRRAKNLTYTKGAHFADSLRR